MAQKTLEPKVYAFINAYREACGDNPTPEQVLLSRYFEEAGNELPIFNGPHWFFSAWRKCDVIPGRSGNKDMVVWHLLHIDQVINDVADQLIEHADEETAHDF
ncbi:hypothetical protein VPZ60_004335 [Salmonella enterica]|nr:hypothetical protein [Salmonella enterica]